MAEKLSKGLFFVFDGPDGCGKSTQSRMIYDDLVTKGFDAVHTAEPGGTNLGHRIRDMLLNKENIEVDRVAELFLFEADRAQHVSEVIKPALLENKIVICDRFNSSTFAYQGFGLGMDMDLVKKIDDASCAGISPDLTLILDIDSEEGLKRAKGVKEADKMEKRGIDFHSRVRRAFLLLAEKSPDKVKVVKVKGTIEETSGVIDKLIQEVVEKYRK